MSKRYRPKEPTGREYVDFAKEFCDLTIMRCSKLPQRWELSLLQPLVSVTEEIEREVKLANKVYIDPKTLGNEALIEAYHERIRHLKEAYSLFAVFDVRFDRLMSGMDIAKAERQRLTAIIKGIIQKEQEKNPDVAKIDIHVHARSDEVEYTSLAGKKCMKLKLSQKQKDAWIGMESMSKDFILKRLQADKKAIKRLTEGAGGEKSPKAAESGVPVGAR